MPLTPSFVKQIHINIPREVTTDAHLESLTPCKTPFAYYGTDTSLENYAYIGFTNVIENTQTQVKFYWPGDGSLMLLLNTRIFGQLYIPFSILLETSFITYTLMTPFQLSDRSKAFSFILPIYMEKTQPMAKSVTSHSIYPRNDEAGPVSRL